MIVNFKGKVTVALSNLEKYSYDNANLSIYNYFILVSYIEDNKSFSDYYSTNVIWKVEKGE